MDAAGDRRSALQIVQDRTPDVIVLDLGLPNDHATRSEQEIRLTPTQWRLVSALAVTPGHLVTPGELLRTAWGPSYRRASNYLRVYADRLRRKLEPDPGHPRYLTTEPSIGYRFTL